MVEWGKGGGWARGGVDVHSDSERGLTAEEFIDEALKHTGRPREAGGFAASTRPGVLDATTKPQIEKRRLAAPEGGGENRTGSCRRARLARL